MSTVLGIDLGMSGARAAVVDERGHLIGRGRGPRSSGALGPFERSPLDWQAEVAAAVRAALADGGGPAIDAIGVGALGPCPVLLDAELRPLAQAPLFSLDDRAEAWRQRLIGEHGLPQEALGPDHVLPRLYWWRDEQPEAVARARCVVDATGFLVAWLTGRPVMDPATLADHACAGIDPPVPLPEVMAAEAIAGGLTAEAARALGLPAGVPVTVGTYDSFADLAGAGATAAGEAGIVLGSTVVLGVVACDGVDLGAVWQAGLRTTPCPGAGAFLGGWTSTSGSLLDWSGAVLATDTPATEPAAPLPGSAGLLALPYLAGERAPVWDVHARGALVGISLQTTAGDLRCALTEAVALSTLDIADRLEGINGSIRAYRAIGGGLRNARWAQATADALGARLEAVAHAGEAIGPAALALNAIGQPWSPAVERAITPDRRRHERYRSLLAIYRRLYPALRETMHELGRLKAREAA